MTSAIDLAFAILKISTEDAIQDAKRYGDEEDINPVPDREVWTNIQDDYRELYRLQGEAEDIRMYYGDIWLLGIGDLYEEIKSLPEGIEDLTTSIERARELLDEMHRILGHPPYTGA
jgi:hypothetical protein